ncbi:hypothetical protein SNOG_09604 [Parastagonospora nodorum SN15]|uniref:Uncharacterized protein n=2 Tax=Phaeosphaeria nodorum (strain SN15 / ATCC MYA-4574 / FGSC 10173) TaxID=321614 RepID=Q0UF60_PHANO|nr:hypothetical protein SNOG_09604 [Parastagonospora nodorum SN15]EAT82869.1 hypothetical protein SNOG_09604 [Parastagonospora nodorum SN15]
MASSSNENDSMNTYTLTPTSAANTSELEASLTARYGASNLIANRQGGRVLAWTLTSRHYGLAPWLESIDGVQSVENRPIPRALNPTDRFMAVPVPGTDTKATGEFLKSKVKSGTEITTVRQDGEVIAWFNLFLSAESFGEVKTHVGVRDVGGDWDTYDLAESDGRERDRSSPRNGGPKLRGKTTDIRLAAGSIAVGNESNGNTQRYRALANETSDPQSMDKYLNSKVRLGHTPGQIKEDDGTIVGWYNLVLDAEAAKEMKDHEGIDSDTLRVQDRVVKF